MIYGCLIFGHYLSTKYFPPQFFYKNIYDGVQPDPDPDCIFKTMIRQWIPNLVLCFNHLIDLQYLYALHLTVNESVAHWVNSKKKTCIVTVCPLVMNLWHQMTFFKFKYLDIGEIIIYFQPVSVNLIHIFKYNIEQS